MSHLHLFIFLSTKKVEFGTYLFIFIHSLINSKSNELPQSMGCLWLLTFSIREKEVAELMMGSCVGFIFLVCFLPSSINENYKLEIHKCTSNTRALTKKGLD